MWIPKKKFVKLGAASCFLFAHMWTSLPVTNAHTQESTNRYEVAGITDPHAFESFFGKLQKWVSKGNKEAIAHHVQFPLRVNSDGQSRFIANEKQFDAEYDQIMTEKVRHALQQQDVKQTFVNYQGVMVGGGELWLRQNGNKFVIVAVNL
ncbi:hypothetical protein [Brevibacillus choshinensis]|uniref:hypothetical protein n=1 Tax=Brevibacillus choshinensis TaxID=54911 RepID=UPI000B000482|nr:hypothetical protein [Brevibacillus choshinensis]